MEKSGKTVACGGQNKAVLQVTVRKGLIRFILTTACVSLTLTSSSVRLEK
jgi:hypothetical protein